MKQISKKRWLFVLAVVTVVVIVLAWPVETWLECRERQFAAKDPPNAVYLVAGAKDQLRRIDALVDFLCKYGNDGSVNNPAFKPMLVLIGNDRLKGQWSSAEQKNLTKAEWAVKFIKSRLCLKKNSFVGAPNLRGESCSVRSDPASSGDYAGQAGARLLQESAMTDDLRIEIVPGIFAGTDGEMEALALYLENHHEIRRLVLVTSPFHIKRSLGRLDLYLSRDISVSAVAAKVKWNDRAPWVVLSELGKIARDSIGWSKVPLLIRRVE